MPLLKGKVMSDKKIIPLLRSTMVALVEHKIILFPFCIIAFLQLFILEILYFAPRYPLNLFFGPLIRRLWSENFLYYPLNLLLLPKLFQSIQIPLYIFVSSFLIAVAISIIASVNSDKKVQFQKAVKENLWAYVHVVIASTIIFAVVLGLFKVYGLVFNRALLIAAQSGVKFWIKQVIILGAPVINLLISIFVTVLFAYVLPIIVIERKKIFAALILNFQVLWKSFWFTFAVVLIPSLLYLPILLLRSTTPLGNVLPDLRVILIVLSIIVIVAIDAIVYSALTTLYLL